MAEVAVNGIPVDTASFATPEAAAARELLRQRAVAAGLVADDADAGATDAAIERLLERDVRTPEPTEAECRRYYEQNAKRFVSGELVAARHILFQVTAGTPVNALRARAERTLSELLHAPQRFAALARECSNCPSGAHDGNLGQLQRGETVPEFERALFDGTWLGIRGELVRTRYGFHIVAVDRRASAGTLPYEAVRERIEQMLRARVLERAIAQYVSVLAGAAYVHGVDLAAAPTPLVQ
ncbi:MAG TPA: peptidylprolyl isomerase [Casimicrobiaceae bacterium]